MGSKMKKYVRNGLVIFSIMALCAAALSVSVGVVQVNGTSMYPNFSNGEIILYSRLHKSIGYGDVIIFQKNSQSYVKRVFGKPGDTVSISDTGDVLVNHVPLVLDQLLLAGTTKAGDLKAPVTLRENEYFVLGDNRPVSLDSRNHELGTVLEEELVGVFLIKLTNE